MGDDFFQTPLRVEFSKAIPPEVLEAVARLDGLINLRAGDSITPEAIARFRAARPEVNVDTVVLPARPTSAN